MRSRTLLLAFLGGYVAGCAAATPPPEPQEELARVDPVEPPPPPPPPEPVQAPEPEPPPPEPPPAEPRTYNVLIVGDSMAATDFGVALEKQLDEHHQITAARWGKSATGLARPDFFDWMKVGSKLVAEHQPDLVVVIIGGNDGQDLIPPKGDRGKRVFWKGSDWETAYRERVTRFLDLLSEQDRQVIWLELPLMDHTSLERKLQLIREVQKTAVEAVDGATWISTRQYFVDDRGKLVRKTKVDGWRSEQALRQEDGIHFTVPGAKFFAERVYPDILSALGL